MSKLSFRCPKCGKDTLSVENIETVKNEWALDSQQEKDLKKHMDEIKMKKYRFWQCPNPKCPNHRFYYETDLDGNLITIIKVHVL